MGNHFLPLNQLRAFVIWQGLIKTVKVVTQDQSNSSMEEFNVECDVTRSDKTYHDAKPQKNMFRVTEYSIES